MKTSEFAGQLCCSYMYKKRCDAEHGKVQIIILLMVDSNVMQVFNQGCLQAKHGFSQNQNWPLLWF